MRTLLLTILASIGVAALLIAITQSIIMSAPVTITHWKFKTRSPVILLYEKVTSILPKCESFSAIINTGKHNSLFAVVLVSGYTLASNLTKSHLIEGIKLLYNNVSKLVIVPFDFSSKELKLSYLFIQLIRNKSLGYALTLINKTNMTSLVSKYKFNITSKMFSNISSISHSFLTSIASYGLMTKMQILPYELYYTQHSLPKALSISLEPLFIVCNTRTKVCVATMYSNLRIVLENVKTQVPIIT